MASDYLNPNRKLVDEVADWLCGTGPYAGKGRVRVSSEGARSLGHVLVVVPTAQSARNLRLALARRADAAGWGGVLPPQITMANALLAPRDVRLATEAEEMAAMASVLQTCEIGMYAALFPKPPVERTVDWALDMAEMLLGISSILGEKALLMSDVRPEVDAERWKNLAALESEFIASLRAHGVTARAVARRDAAAAGCREPGIEEIVLPAAVDVTGAFVTYLEHSSQDVTLLLHADPSELAKFDAWGRPVATFAAALGPEMIETAPTAVVEADEIAKVFRVVRSEEALPALAVCDAEMYPELEGAFQNHFSDEELVLRNPAKEQLASSSLGRLLGAIIRLSMNDDYETFSTLVRMGDVARWARAALGASAADVARFVGALDAVQNAHLPRTLAETVAGAKAEAESAWHEEDRTAAAGLARLAEAVKAELADPVGFLKRIFATRMLDEQNPGDRELIAAAQTVRDLQAACSGDLIPKPFRRKLFAKLLGSAIYMLEPTAENVLVTTGWLEVSWCSEDEIVIAGFNEGCVPENIVGHPFVPDSLRAALGISTNAQREARDSFVLAQAVRCRAKGAVSVWLHQIAGDKNVMKPSRILFNGIADEDLPALALRLYAVTKGNEGAPPKELPEAWTLRLPFPPKGTAYRPRISVTALDQYQRCPFNFYLQELFGEHADDRNQELDARTFGNLCHAALEAFAKTGPKDSTDAGEIVAFLADEVRRQLRVFGDPLPTIVELQGEAAIARLQAFAPHQAARRKAGWRIVSAEQNLSCRFKDCPTVVSGKVDRIDRNERTGEIAIVDYKTWNRAREENYDSLQLPAYRAMVEVSGLFSPAEAQASKALYCVLAERAEDVMFDDVHACHAGLQGEAEAKIVGLLEDLAKGLFYPPKREPGGSAMVWQRNYGELVWESPERGIDPAWLADQASRRGEVRA